MIALEPDAIVVVNAADYTAKEIKKAINNIRKENPKVDDLKKRTNISLLNEWAAHAICCHWNIMKERAQDAFLQFDMEPEVKFMYSLIGPVARFFLMFYRKKKTTANNS